MGTCGYIENFEGEEKLTDDEFYDIISHYLEDDIKEYKLAQSIKQITELTQCCR